ncbi:MAG: leucine-rich repeat protein [Clostridia bacterium]|nr:leucine-rich repeat protein [Clostridia bacterium]
MKLSKIFILLLSLTLVLSALSACNGDKQDGEDSANVYYTVTFNSNGGTAIEPKLVQHGGYVDEPPTPEKDGFIFDGWYDGARKWAFSFSVDKDMTLTAHWVSSENMFAHTPTGDGETTVITKLKQNAEDIRIPTVIGGYRVTAIADSVFANLSSENVYKIVLPESVTTVGNESFYNCADIEIVVEGTLSSVGEKAFYGCNALTSVTLGGGIETIALEAFASSGLTSITLPESVRMIDENAFENCASLKTVFAYDSIETIGDSAFFEAGIVTVYFYGTDENIINILDTKTEPQNESFSEAKIYLYSETEPAEETEFKGFFYFDDNGKTRIW